jgi:N-acyl-D-aspartate/D-glutamate deacylase
MENFTTKLMEHSIGRFYPLGVPPDYEPPRERSVSYLAKARGESEHSVLYDLLLEHDGRGFLLLTYLNYVHEDYGSMEMLLEPDTLTSLGDAGAHVRLICDASIHSFTLTHWVRDRARGPRLPLEVAVAKMTSNNARVFGFSDRGELTVGKRADINVIDLENLAVPSPKYITDLPGGAARLVQDATGYTATFVRGVMTRSSDQDTGERPGRLLPGRAKTA